MDVNADLDEMDVNEDLVQMGVGELIERSSLGADAAASYRARATAEDYAQADLVLDLVDELDRE
ncbi:hypothetical protein [Lentzea sp. CA-135723]|uniref:hypothetical protein n=1 Tax=Lentzea sp. CA-135723 TaxID=3239950 RepID=UPI003D90DEED